MGLTTGSILSLTIADPFELSQTVECVVVGIDSFDTGAEVETIFVRAEHPLPWAGREYNHLALRARQGNGIVDELKLGPAAECTGLGVPADFAAGGPPWGIDAWRGGLAILATARLI